MPRGSLWTATIGDMLDLAGCGEFDTPTQDCKAEGGRMFKQAEDVLSFAEGKVLDVGYERTCECQANHMNCLSAKEWLEGYYRTQCA